MENSSNLTAKYERYGWPSLTRPDLKPPDGWNLSFLTSLERIRSHALSPDSEAIAYIKDGESRSDLYLLPSNGGWPARITTDRTLVPFWDDETPEWSSDGHWLAFVIDGHVHVTSRSGGLPKKITDFTTSAKSPRWMPDSVGIIVTVERNEIDQLVLTDRGGSWPRALTTDTQGDHWDVRPAPDGKSIIYVLRRLDDLNRLDIVHLELATGQLRILFGKPSIRANFPRWSPDGEWVGFINQDTGHEEIWLIRPDGEGLHQLTKRGEDIIQFDWSPDSKQLAVIFYRNGAYDFSLIDAETGIITDLRSSLGIHTNPNWSKDGAFITYEYESPLAPPDLFRIDLASQHVTQLTFSTPPALATNQLIQPVQVNYKSFDDLEIPAFLYLPKKPNGAAILYPHGGPKDHSGFFWDEMAQYFTAKGYAYFAPNYRGSTGYGKSFERSNYNDWGSGDTKDCLYGARYLRTLPGIKPERIGIMGGSYGGYLTVCALARDPEYLFSCGVMKYGDANLISSWAQCERRLRFYSEIFLGHPAANRTTYLKGSPILEIKNIQRPILVLHGLLDTICPPESSEELVEVLRREQKTFEYKTYADEPHGILRRENQLDAYARIERFLDWYLFPS